MGRWLSESADFCHWTRPVLGMEPGPEDGAGRQFRGMQMTPYGAYVLGWVSVLNTEERDLRAGEAQGRMDVELAYSRDGCCWHRAAAPGKSFIPRGPAGAWDAGMVTPSSGPVLLEHKLLFLYSGTPYGHGAEQAAQPEGVGAATLRVDGFVGLHAGEEPCELMTRAFAVRAPGVFVNADALDGQVLWRCATAPRASPWRALRSPTACPYAEAASRKPCAGRGTPTRAAC